MTSISYTGRITSPRKERKMILSDEFDNTTSLLDLLLGGAGDVSGLDDERGVDSALTELDVSECSPITASGLDVPA